MTVINLSISFQIFSVFYRESSFYHNILYSRFYNDAQTKLAKIGGQITLSTLSIKPNTHLKYVGF